MAASVRGVEKDELQRNRRKFCGDGNVCYLDRSDDIKGIYMYVKTGQIVHFNMRSLMCFNDTTIKL